MTSTLNIKDLVPVTEPWTLEPGDVVYLNPKIEFSLSFDFLRDRYPLLICDKRKVKKTLNSTRRIISSEMSYELRFLFATGQCVWQYAPALLVYDPVEFRKTKTKLFVYFRAKRLNEL